MVESTCPKSRSMTGDAGVTGKTGFPGMVGSCGINCSRGLTWAREQPLPHCENQNRPLLISKPATRGVETGQPSPVLA